MSSRSTKPVRFPTVDDLMANATDFLKSATADLTQRPKHSVIAFYTAVELILKARLMAEHWTLAVSKNPDRGAFAKGDFVSVRFDEACTRLQNVVGSPLPNKAKAIFNSLRQHRNKMVHFYHEGEADRKALEAIALEQLAGWRALIALLEQQWQPTFINMIFDIVAIDAGFAQHRHYAKAKFESLADRLAEMRKSGSTIAVCRSCSFEAAECDEGSDDLVSSRCLVCDDRRLWMVSPCPHCSGELRNEGDDGATCEHCSAYFSVEDLVGELNEEVFSKDSYLDGRTPANCANCDSYHTVISWKGEYICLACIAVTADATICGWCGDPNNGDLEMSAVTGCSACEGNVRLLED